MSLTGEAGYNYKSSTDIAPFLEPSGSGITSLWARTVALKFNCYVAVGYPERVEIQSPPPPPHLTETCPPIQPDQATSERPSRPKYYNSAIVVNEDGETIANYRKRFLHDTDASWAVEGDGGFHVRLMPGLGPTCVSICKLLITNMRRRKSRLCAN